MRALPAVVLLAALVASGAVSGPASAEDAIATRTFSSSSVSPDGWVRSAPETTATFSLVGLAIPHGAIVRVRTAAGDEPWSDWTFPLGGHESDAESDEHNDGFTEPIWAGRANRIQIEVDGAVPEQVTAHLVTVDGANGLRAAAACTPDLTLADGPTVVSRTAWGAAAPNEEIEYADQVAFGVIHHTAGGNDYLAADGCDIVRSIQRYHMGSRGWADIGYNLLVDKYGTVYEGRAGGLEKNVIGAHALGHNSGSFGTAVLGNFAEGGEVTQQLHDALAELIAWKFVVHGINPAEDAMTVTEQGDPVPTLLGHRDVVATTCPGQALYDELPAIRHTVSTLVNWNPIPDAVVTDGIPVVGDWDGDGVTTAGWFLNARWYLVNSFEPRSEVWIFDYGRPTDIPIVGDWDGDGDDTVGVVRDAQWRLRNTNTDGPPDLAFGFGKPTDVPIAGNWDGVAGDEPGIRRGKTFRLRYDLSWGKADVIFGFGIDGDLAITGDFNGDGVDDVGVVRDNAWRLRYAHAGGSADSKFYFARPNEGDIPVTGDWDGDGTTTVGIVRGESWRLKNVHEGGKADVLVDSIG